MVASCERCACVRFLHTDKGILCALCGKPWELLTVAAPEPWDALLDVELTDCTCTMTLSPSGFTPELASITGCPLHDFDVIGAG